MKNQRKNHKEISFSQEEEEKQIEEALKTPFEKVIKILTKVTQQLKGNALAKDVQWVIKVINSRQLYSFQGITASDKKDVDSMEMKSLIGYLDQCSERKNKFEGMSKKLSQTTKLKTLSCAFLQPRVKSDFAYISNHHLDSIEDDHANEKESDEMYSELVFDTHSSEEEGCNSNRNSNGNPTANANLNANNANGLSSSSPETKIYKEKTEILTLESSSFDIFNYYQIYGDKAFEIGAGAIFSNISLEKYSSSQQLKNFIKAVKDNYSTEAYYHNEKHGLDVLQTIYVYITTTPIAVLLNLSDIDIIAMTVGALVHDLGHRGYTNDFQIKTQSELAIQYNDKNVLENYHLTRTFQLLQVKYNNILEKFAREEYKICRKRMIEMILSTDMLCHSKNIALMKSHIDPVDGKFLPLNQDNQFDEQQDVMNFLLHTADISHCSKAFDINYQWTELLSKEFFRQGDIEKEKNVSISFLCNRITADIPRSQIGFIKGIIMPTFDLLTNFLPDLGVYKENVQKNLIKWGELIQENDHKDEDIKGK